MSAADRAQLFEASANRQPKEGPSIVVSKMSAPTKEAHNAWFVAVKKTYSVALRKFGWQ